MAAIDKIYAKTFYEYDDFLKWVIIYYPKMLVRFYDIHITADEWNKSEKYHLENTREIYKRDLEKLGKFKNEEEAILNLIDHYANVGYECPVKQARDEVEWILEASSYDDFDIMMNYSMPIATLTFKQDKILKWRCPIPFIREYLETHCGIKTRWYHKLFWKGKKIFN